MLGSSDGKSYGKNMSRMRVNKRKHCSVTSENLANTKCLTDMLSSCRKEQLRFAQVSKEKKRKENPLERFL